MTVEVSWPRKSLTRPRRHLRWIAGCLIGNFLGMGQAQIKNKTTASAIERQADSAREQGDIPAAIRLYHRALLQNPRWQQGWWYYGSLLYDSNEYSQAAVALRRLVGFNPTLGEAWALLGLSEFETRKFDPALKHLQRARDVGLGDSGPLANVADYHLALLLNTHGEFERARPLLSSLLLRGVNSEDLQIGMGMNLLRVPLLPSQLDPSKDALVHDAGNIAALMTRKQFDQADAGFRQLLAKYPSAHFAHYAYGGMLASHDREDLAKAQFREETALTPDSAFPYMEWAFLESKAANYRDSLPLAQKAVALAPNSFVAHYLFGEALLATGSIPASVTQLESARSLAPDSPEVRYTLSRAYTKAGERDKARREQMQFTTLRANRQSKLREGEELIRSPKDGSTPAPSLGSPSLDSPSLNPPSLDPPSR